MLYGPATIVVMLGIGLLMFIGTVMARGGRCKPLRKLPGAAPDGPTCARCGDRTRSGGQYCPRCGQKIGLL